jgi:hypothetical protein
MDSSPAIRLQLGKRPCDRMAATIKENVRRYVNEYNDCTGKVENSFWQQKELLTIHFLTEYSKQRFQSLQNPQFTSYFFWI